ncbi:MAG: SHOCT domain-containing protein [Gammaproteobacteria bacterium]|jgi:hypothetical protein|nr:SHOCT domain-containing protein [Gammaproteobacteria bacterium]
MKTKTPLILSLMLLLPACGQTPLIHAGADAITVSSEPSGASIYVMGKKITETPAVIDLSAVYPVTYAQELQSDYGRITLKHEGCEDRIITVSSGMMSNGLKVKLDCVTAKEPQVAAPASTAAQRLEELQVLKAKGLLSEEEYQTIRNRILDSL